MTRTTLPHRRPNVTVSVNWQGRLLEVTVGLDPATAQPAEVFASTEKGGDMHNALADACVLISIALQHGITPAELAKSLGRVPVFTGDEDATGPASPIGAIVEAIIAEVR